MVFNTSWFIVLGISLSIIWLSIVTVFLIRLQRHYNNLTRGVSKKGLIEILTKLIETHEQVENRVTELESQLKALEADGVWHYQKLGIVRFNPFSDTGGSQSFSLAILDGHNNGIVMTSLHARSGNRWYVKEIVQGKGINVELSKEEQAAIRTAQRHQDEKTV